MLHQRVIEHLLSRPPLLYRVGFPGARWRIPSMEGKSIYLTFDDGPIPEVTPWVLDHLDRYGIKATFFCVGENVLKHPHIFKELLERGHRVGNHTHHHIKGLTTPTDAYIEDVLRADALIGSHYFRPPYGHLHPSQVRKLNHHFEIIMWDLVTRDYNPDLSAKDVFRTVCRYARNGSIIVFHDSLKSWPRLQEALPQSIEWLLQEGYTFRRIGDAP